MTLEFDEQGEPIKPVLPKFKPNPTVLNAELQEHLCAALYNLIPTKAACTLVGISTNTFYAWMTKGRNGDPKYVEFTNEVEKALAQAQAKLVKTVTDSAVRGNTTDAKWLLERKFSDEWGRRDKVEVGGDVNQAITVQLTWPGQEQAALEAGEDPDIVDAEIVEEEAVEGAEDEDRRQTA